jgi:hypothetical protein
MKQPRYSFQSQWNIGAPRAQVWRALSAKPFSWQDWWPELGDVHDMKLTKHLSGTTFSCRWRSPSGYHLRSDVSIGEVLPQRQVTLHSAGDLRGTVTCRLGETAGSTRIDIDWQVETTKAWMRYLALLLRPLFIYNHHAVMRSGERGLQQYVQSKNLI